MAFDPKPTINLGWPNEDEIVCISLVTVVMALSRRSTLTTNAACMWISSYPGNNYFSSSSCRRMTSLVYKYTSQGTSIGNCAGPGAKLTASPRFLSPMFDLLQTETHTATARAVHAPARRIYTPAGAARGALYSYAASRRGRFTGNPPQLSTQKGALASSPGPLWRDEATPAPALPPPYGPGLELFS